MALNWSALLGAQRVPMIAQLGEALRAGATGTPMQPLNPAQIQEQYNLSATQQQQAATQQSQQQIAQNRWGMLANWARRNPAYVHDPAFRRQITRAARQLGMPNPVRPDGSVDQSVFYGQPDPTNPEDMRYLQGINALPGGARGTGSARENGYLSAGWWPSDTQLTASAGISPKDHAALDRAQMYGMSVTERNQIQQSRLRIDQERTDAVAAGDYARVQQIDANIAQLGPKLAIAQENASAHLTEAGAAVTRAQQAVIANQIHASTATVRGVILARQGILGSINALNADIARLNAAQSVYLNGNGEVGDPRYTANQATIASETAQLKALHDSLPTLPNFGAAAAAQALHNSGAAGVQAPSGAPAIPPQYNAAGYKPIKVNGKWFMTNDNGGTWYDIP